MVRRSRIWKFRVRRYMSKQTVTRGLKGRLEKAGFKFDGIRRVH